MRGTLHPFWGTLAIAAGAIGASLTASFLTAGVGAFALGRRGIPVSREAIAEWVGSPPLLPSFLMWVLLIPTCLWLGRRVAGLSRATMGLDQPGGRSALLRGLLFGIALLVVPAVIGRLCGGYVPVPDAVITSEGQAVGGLVALPFLLPLLGVAAFGEELLLRGLLLRYWERSLRLPAAVVLSAAAFTAAHVANPNPSVLGAMGVWLAGVLLAIALIRSGNLWFPVGIHLGWNVATTCLVGLPVSGYRMTTGIVSWDVADTDLARSLLGGTFGPEEGLAFHASLTLGLLWLLVRPHQRQKASLPGEPSSGVPQASSP